MTCPRCGFQPTIGRPKKLNDTGVLKLRKAGWKLAEIAKFHKVSTSAVQHSLKRTEKKK